MTHISIIGTGNMGQAISALAGKGGNSVELFNSSDVGKPATGDIVVLAVPYPAVSEVIAQRADQLAGKVVVDITNPVDLTTFEPLPVEGSGAQEIAAAAPSGARVVKAFNTTFAGTLVEGKVAGQPLDVFIAGDDDGAKATVKQLVEDGGMRAVDAGPLARARELEALGYLHMALQEPLGTGFASSVKVVA